MLTFVDNGYRAVLGDSGFIELLFMIALGITSPVILVGAAALWIDAIRSRGQGQALEWGVPTAATGFGALGLVVLVGAVRHMAETIVALERSGAGLVLAGVLCLAMLPFSLVGRHLRSLSNPRSRRWAGGGGFVIAALAALGWTAFGVLGAAVAAGVPLALVVLGIFGIGFAPDLGTD